MNFQSEDGEIPPDTHRPAMTIANSNAEGTKSYLTG